MNRTLIDAGPLIALFNNRDRYHHKITDFLRAYSGELVTTWPVLTETCHVLDFNIQAQIDFLKWIRMGGVQIAAVDYQDITRIISLSEKYADIPMDLADATLIVVAEKLNISDIVTIDSDYYVYRTIRKKMLHNIFI